MPILLFILALFFSHGYADKSTSSKTEPQNILQLHILDPKDVPGKWLIMSNRDSSNPNLDYLFLFNQGKLKRFIPGKGLYRAKWSSDGSMILACEAGDPISFIHVFTEDGKLLQTIETNRLSVSFDWVDDKRIIYSDGWTSDTEEGLVILKNLESGKNKVLYKTPFKYEANNLRISPDRTKLIFSIDPILSGKGTPRSVLVDLKTFKIKEIDLIAGLAGWLLDNKNVIVRTNWKLDKSDFNDRFGVIAKYNIETNELTAIKDCEEFYRQVVLSKDGRYIYYARSTKSGGVAAFVQSIESNHEWQITKPVYVSSEVGMSTDIPTSWIPDEKIDFLRDLSEK